MFLTGLLLPWRLASTRAGPREPGLLAAIEPAIAAHLSLLRDGLHQTLRTHPRAPLDTDTVLRLLCADLPGQLYAMVSRTMVLELHVARLEGRLRGKAPEDRFSDFVERLRDPAVARAIMREYPVLEDQVKARLDQWVAVSLEFLERLSADRDLILEAFTPGADLGVLERLETDVSDRHRKGRCVFIAQFSKGLRLVYKPKPLSVDVHFQELLRWMNARDASLDLRTLRVLNRGTYGWEEFVGPEPCTSLPALHRFYERQGAYLALLYALEATDCHCDNIIAAGEHPVLVDVETLFHPRCAVPGTTADAATINESVLRVGLLPLREWCTAESEGVDLSGIGGVPGQLTPNAQPDWEEAGTDEMRLTRRRVEIPVAGNRPAPELDPADYTADILAGFTRAYRGLMEHREELCSDRGPLAPFAQDEVRAIMRPTTTYGELLSESFHPDVLRKTEDRERLFERLSQAVASLPYLSRVIQAERADLRQGDIPIFTTRPSSRDVWTSSGERIADFYDRPALTAVHNRLRQLGERDLSLQDWMIRAALAAGSTRQPSRASHPVGGVDSSRRRPLERDELLAGARCVGDRLTSLAICANAEISWVGLTAEHESQWFVSPLTLDLYDGLPGVTLFLAYLGAMTGEPRYTNVARAACAGVLRRVRDSKSFVRCIGGFAGWGGILFMLAQLGALWHEPDLELEAEAVVELLPAWIEQDDQFDIIGGAAGCIGGLLALHQRRPSQRTLQAAVACGEHLLRRSQRTDPGVGWTVPGQRVPLAGFSHGAAGIAWALLKLAALSGEQRFRATALAALTYERSLFSLEAGNWPDLRVSAGSTSFMTAWCHGAPGIGLARLATLQELDDEAVRLEIDIAVRATLDQGFGRGHSLCHGDLGNLELLLQAGTVLPDRCRLNEAYHLAGPIVDSVRRNEWRCDTPRGVESPGLMTGLAGIGYGLLRLTEPARVPSVLTLEPPLERPQAHQTPRAPAGPRFAGRED